MAVPRRAAASTARDWHTTTVTHVLTISPASTADPAWVRCGYCRTPVHGAVMDGKTAGGCPQCGAPLPVSV